MVNSQDGSEMKKKKQGFASMSKERHAQVSAKGGKGTPPEQRNFALDPDLASSAGQKGGMVSKKGKRK